MVFVVNEQKGGKEVVKRINGFFDLPERHADNEPTELDSPAGAGILDPT